MTTFPPRSTRIFRTIDRRTTARRVAARNIAPFLRDLARFVAFLLRTAVIALLFLPALLAAVIALIWNAPTPVLKNSSRRHRKIRPTILFGFLFGVALGRSCTCR